MDRKFELDFFTLDYIVSCIIAQDCELMTLILKIRVYLPHDLNLWLFFITHGSGITNIMLHVFGNIDGIDICKSTQINEKYYLSFY